MRQRQSDGQAWKESAFSSLSAVLIALGIGLRAWQYLGRSALWTDEAALANNIISRPYGRFLLEPLGHNQAAPPGFLVVERAAVSMFGANELALRAFPFLCSIIALLLLWRVATRLLTAAVIPLALAPFALAPSLIFFAAEAKQYSTDVALALALLLLALDLGSRELTTQRAALAAIAGAVAVWFSQSAVLVVAGLGGAMMLSAIVVGDRRRLVREACIVGTWAASAIAVTALSLRRLAPDARRYMYLFWNDGFWPLAPLHPGSAAWPAVRTAGLLAGQLALPMSVGIAATLCAAVGVWATWRKDRRVAMLLVAPLLVALGASAARLYPFAERLALFLIPSLLVLAAAGLDAIVAVISSRRLASVAIAGAAVAFLALDARALRAAPPVYRPEEITPAIEYLRQNAKQTDAIYVYYGAVPAFQFYESTRAIPGMHLLGTCHRDDPRGYLTELDRYRGDARTWVLFAHVLPRLREREIMLRYLDAIGSARDSMATLGRDVQGNVTAVQLYLYDLSAGARTSDATATSAQLPEQPPLEPRFACAPD